MLNERDLQTIWYGGREPSWLLRVLAGIYGALSSVRRGIYTSGLLARKRLPVPIVVVGNITVGGTGKTPLVIALVEALRARGWNPGVISRGYAGSTGKILHVDAQSDPLIVGDEACLIFAATQAPMIVGRDRVEAGRVLLNSAAVDVLIGDDGLQHYKLCRDVEICVIDGARRFGNGRLLPAGPLRELVARLDSIAFRVCNGGAPETGEVAMTLSGDLAIGLNSQSPRPLRDFAGQRVHAVAGIGNPDRFFAQLRVSGLEVIEHPFDDHFPFAAKDLDFSDDLAVLMTEKDAVKCRGFALTHHWYVPVRASVPAAFLDAVAERLRVAQKCRD
jgi:tetraacyldisaccharide 4'-kinase